MKTMSKVILVTFIVGGLIFARTGKSDPRSVEKNAQSKSDHYWVKDVSIIAMLNLIGSVPTKGDGK